MINKNECEPSFSDFVDELATRSPNPKLRYYLITLTGDKKGRVIRSIYSQWVGYADRDSRIEIREASHIHAEIAVPRLRQADERCLVVDSAADLAIFFLVGGHAAIESDLSNSEISEWLRPEEVIMDGLYGFTSVYNFPKSFKNRAPTPRVRMEVLKRDEYRCRICGRRATDYVDVELHVHHVRPWAQGGATIVQNLITLCQTCHNGLSPHYERDLHDILDRANVSQTAKNRSAVYRQAVQQYQETLLAYDIKD